MLTEWVRSEQLEPFLCTLLGFYLTFSPQWAVGIKSRSIYGRETCTLSRSSADNQCFSLQQQEINTKGKKKKIKHKMLILTILCLSRIQEKKKTNQTKKAEYCVSLFVPSLFSQTSLTLLGNLLSFRWIILSHPWIASLYYSISSVSN